MNLHLDPQVFERLLAGQLTFEQELRLAAHLQQDCPQCDEFLESLSEESVGTLFSILARTHNPADLPQAARERVLDKRTTRSFKLPMLVPVAGLAFLLLLGIIITIVGALGQEERENADAGFRIKGDPSTEAHVELSLGRVVDDASKKVERIASGEILEPRAKLVFTINSDKPCFVYLIRIDASTVDVLVPFSGGDPVKSPGGVFTPTIDGRPAGMSLTELDGLQHFVTICAPEALVLEDHLQTISKALRAGEQLTGGSADFALDTVHLTVNNSKGSR